MKWYKRDPAAALEGMLGLTIEERGAYNALIDLIYARAPRGGVTDELVCKALGCRPQVWQRLKASLWKKGKIWENPPGNLLCNRVVSEVVSSEFRMRNLARLGQVSALKRNELKQLLDGMWQNRDPTATLETPTSRSRSKDSSFLTAARKAAEEKRSRPRSVRLKLVLLNSRKSMQQNKQKGMFHVEKTVKIPGEMSFVTTSAPIDLSAWGLPDEITELVRAEFARNPPIIHFPIGFDFGDNPQDGNGGPPPTDPVMLHMSLSLSENEGNPCIYACSLEDVVDDLIEGYQAYGTGMIDGPEMQRNCRRVAQRLRELADKLESKFGAT